MNKKRLEYKIGILDPQPGQILVIKYNCALTAEQHAHVSEIMRSVYRGKCLILDGNVDLKVVAEPVREAA